MLFNFFKSKKGCLGVDLGTAAIKIVELSKEKGGFVLTNYALTEPKEAGSFRTTDLSITELGELIKQVISEMKPQTKKAVMSLPVASSFSTLVELPAMNEAELAAAIPFEAKKFIPIPLEEVELDWSVVESAGETKIDDRQIPHSEQEITKDIGGSSSVMGSEESLDSLIKKTQDLVQVDNQNIIKKSQAVSSRGENRPAADLQAKTNGNALKKSAEGEAERKVTPKTQVILVAVPKEVIKKYTKVAEIAGLNLLSLEQEAFSLARSLVKGRAGVFLIADIGNNTTDLLVVEDGYVRVTHNLETVARELVIVEIKRVVNLYKEKYNKKVHQCILAGGKILAGASGSFSVALAKEWTEVFKNRIGLEVKVGDALEGIVYPPALRAKMKELSPALAVAVGLAMREL